MNCPDDLFYALMADELARRGVSDVRHTVLAVMAAAGSRPAAGALRDHAILAGYDGRNCARLAAVHNLSERQVRRILVNGGYTRWPDSMPSPPD